MEIHTESSERIRLDKYNKAWPTISLLMEWARSVSMFKMLFACFLSAVCGLSMLVWYLSGINPVISACIAFLPLLVASLFIALYISNRFSVLLTDGFKDSFFILSAFGGYIFINIFVSVLGPARGFIFTNLLVIGLSAALVLFYVFRVMPKKLPNLTLALPADADRIIDIECGSYDHLSKKVRIDGDTRNAFLLNSGPGLRFYIKPDVKSIKTAVAYAYACGGSARIDLYESMKGSERRLIVSKHLNPSTNFETRGWCDLDLGIVNSSAGTYLEIEHSSGGHESRGKSYIAHPRFSGTRKEPRKIIVIVADAVRSDHLGLYGYSRNTSPNIDKFGKDALKMENAMVQGEWTLPSFMSMMTSTYPSVHGVYHHEAHATLSKEIKTLPEALRENGFITRGIFTHMRLVPYFGFARGLDSHFFKQCDKENHVADADDVTLKAIDLLEFHKKDDLFLMMHYFDTHQPCIPSGTYNSLFKNDYKKDRIHDVRNKLLNDAGFVFGEDDIKDFMDSYDTEIFKVDMRFGMLIDYLKRSGQYENSCVIFLADHGMLLNDHGSMSAITLFDESMKVPFLVKFPQTAVVEKESVTDFTSEACIDIMPTILDIYGMKIPQTCHGKSIRRVVMPGGNPGFKDHAISEYFFKDRYGVSVRDRSFRYTIIARFDIKDFRNYRNDMVKEELYSVNNNSPETLYKGRDEKSLVEKYRGIIDAHIKNSIDKARGYKK